MFEVHHQPWGAQAGQLYRPTGFSCEQIIDTESNVCWLLDILILSALKKKRLSHQRLLRPCDMWQINRVVMEHHPRNSGCNT